MSAKHSHAYSPVAQDVAQSTTQSQTRSGQLDSSWTWTALHSRWTAAKSRTLTFCDANAGMLLIMSAQLFFAFMNLSVKILNSLDEPVPTLELIAVRMAITFTCCVTYMLVMKIPDPFLGPKGVRLLLVSRGLCGFFGLFGMYYSLKYLSLADATVLTFLNPLTTALAGYLILKEAYSKREAAAAVCSLLGVILIARPPFLFGVNAHGNDSVVNATPMERLRAVGVALVGVCVGTLAVISLRAIGKRAHPLHSMTFFSLWCVIVSSTAMIVLEVPVVYPRKWSWGGMLLFIGFCGFLAQTMITTALQRETAARSAMGAYLQVIFAGLLEYAFFGTVPSLLSLVGAGIIVVAAVWVVLSKKPASTPGSKLEEHDISLDLRGGSSLRLHDLHDGSALEEGRGLLQGRDSGIGSDSDSDLEVAAESFKS